MNNKIDATENPSQQEKTAAESLSATQPMVTSSAIMSDRVIFSSASARILAVEQVKGNKIPAMKPGIDSSLASSTNWKLTNGNNISFGKFHGKSCMKTTGTSSPTGVNLDYFEDAPLCSQGRLMVTSIDVYAESPAQIRLGAADETDSLVELSAGQTGRWIRISTVLRPTGMRNFQIYNNTAGAVVYFRNAKVEFFTSTATLYTPQTEDNVLHADLEFAGGCNTFLNNDQVFFFQKNPATGTAVRQYWKLVTSVGEDWIEFSSTDSEGSSRPEAGDWIAQLGNRSDVKRQSALVQEFTSGGKIQIVWYEGIDSFSMVDKDRMHIGNGAIDAETMDVGIINSSTIKNKGNVETNTLNVKSRIDAGTIVATGNITTTGTLTASKIEGDFPVTIPDDLKVKTVTASGTVKAPNGEFDAVTVRGENATAKLTSIGVVVSAPSNAYVNTISPNLLDLKRRGDSIFYLETSAIDTILKINNLPVGIPTGSFPVNMQSGQIFLDEDTKKNGTYVLRIKK